MRGRRFIGHGHSDSLSRTACSPSKGSSDAVMVELDVALEGIFVRIDFGAESAWKESISVRHFVTLKVVLTGKR